MGFPVFARGTCPYDSRDHQRVIDIGLPVEIAGVRFDPGDLVVADLDGIVVVPRRIEAAVIPRAWAKVHAETRMRMAIEGGRGRSMHSKNSESSDELLASVVDQSISTAEA